MSPKVIAISLSIAFFFLLAIANRKSADSPLSRFGNIAQIVSLLFGFIIFAWPNESPSTVQTPTSTPILLTSPNYTQTLIPSAADTAKPTPTTTRTDTSVPPTLTYTATPSLTFSATWTRTPDYQSTIAAYVTMTMVSIHTRAKANERTKDIQLTLTSEVEASATNYKNTLNAAVSATLKGLGRSSK